MVRCEARVSNHEAALLILRDAAKSRSLRMRVAARITNRRHKSAFVEALFWPRLPPTFHVARASLMANRFCAGGPDDCWFSHPKFSNPRFSSPGLGAKHAPDDTGSAGARGTVRHRQLWDVARRFQK